MSDIASPHDRFVKEVFSRPEVAADLLSHYLPCHVWELLQPTSFRLCKDSFVDADLREYFSDLLYRVDFKEGQQGFVYILFEHKSYPAPDIAFQLLRYMTRIWEYSTRQEAGALPAVIPVVLYHGSARWNVPLEFASLYRAPESLKESLCDFTYYLCDLKAYTDGEIKLGAMAMAAVLLLKHIHSGDLAERLRDIFGLLRAMNEQNALEFLRTVLRYLGAATKSVTVEDYRRAVKAAFADKGDMFMDRLSAELVEEQRKYWTSRAMAEGIERGIEKGIEKGMKEGAASVTVRLLSRKFGSLDAALEERVRELSLQELEQLGEELLDFPDESALRKWLNRVRKAH
ncbi:MAG: Rpn family recombination-promoting nuclease/putative transposase [Thermodesulfobacteriota bacterium]